MASTGSDAPRYRSRRMSRSGPAAAGAALAAWRGAAVAARGGLREAGDPWAASNAATRPDASPDASPGASPDAGADAAADAAPDGDAAPTATEDGLAVGVAPPP